jgi:hypothetical protein
MANIGTLTAHIGADTSRLRGDTVRAKKMFRGMAGEMKHTIGIMAGFTVAGYGAAKALGKLADATKLAARIEVMNHVLEMTGEAAGYTESELKKYRNQIRGLGIATKEAIGIEQLFIQSKLKVADALKISRAAQNLATIAGTNSSEAAKTLTQAIVAQRPILLKQFGIIASLDKIYNKQAKTLGKTRAELTETEKRQGFMNEILAQASTLAGAYETAMRDVGKQITSLPRYYADAAAALGEHFLPQMEFAVGSRRCFDRSRTRLVYSMLLVMRSRIMLRVLTHLQIAMMNCRERRNCRKTNRQNSRLSSNV